MNELTQQDYQYLFDLFSNKIKEMDFKIEFTDKDTELYFLFEEQKRISNYFKEKIENILNTF